MKYFSIYTESLPNQGRYYSSMSIVPSYLRRHRCPPIFLLFSSSALLIFDVPSSFALSSPSVGTSLISDDLIRTFVEAQLPQPRGGSSFAASLPTLLLPRTRHRATKLSTRRHHRLRRCRHCRWHHRRHEVITRRESERVGEKEKDRANEREERKCARECGK